MRGRGGAAVGAVAASVTRAASLQSYLTVRWLADPAYRTDGFALYAYFRWLDDMVDEHLGDEASRRELVTAQRSVLAAAVDGAVPAGLAPQEALLASLVGHDRGRPGTTSDRSAAGGSQPEGLLAGLEAMLDVMEVDAGRRGRALDEAALDRYTQRLAVAVTESLHHCIGHGAAAPHGPDRYVAVRGAHVAHMLRDLVEDLEVGYVNLPASLAGDGHPSLARLHERDVRVWVRDRVQLARSCFTAGRRAFGQVESTRCRLAGHAYIARFEWVLDAIEHDGYRVRSAYPERATFRGGARITLDGVRSALTGTRPLGRPAVGT